MRSLKITLSSNVYLFLYFVHKTKFVCDTFLCSLQNVIDPFFLGIVQSKTNLSDFNQNCKSCRNYGQNFDFNRLFLINDYLKSFWSSKVVNVGAYPKFMLFIFTYIYSTILFFLFQQSTIVCFFFFFFVTECFH